MSTAIDADVIIVGGGPTGLMLATELRLAGARPILLEREPCLGETSKANGFSGQILQLLRYRGLLDRIEAASNGAINTAPQVPFGGLHLDTSHLADGPLQALSLPQHRLERILEEYALELGAEVRRGHDTVGVSQDDLTVTAEVEGPAGRYRVTARYLVGCDGAHSIVRGLTGIAFPGATYPEVNRLAQVALHDSVSRLDSGDLDVPGVGRIKPGFSRTDRGVFALGSLSSGVLMIQTTEPDAAEIDDAVPLTVTEFQESVRRVLGVDLPLGRASRLSRYQFQARQAERYVDRRILLAGDAAHQFPATGIAINVGMLDAVNLGWKLAADIRGRAPTGLLATYHHERHFAGARAMLQSQAQVALRRGLDPAADALRDLFQELLSDEPALRRIGALIAGTDIRYLPRGANHHALVGTFVSDLPLNTDSGRTSVKALLRNARPVLLDMADRPDLRAAAQDWTDRVEVRVAVTEPRPADALLIRPDAHTAWASGVGEPTHTAVPMLREALSGWFGSGREQQLDDE